MATEEQLENPKMDENITQKTEPETEQVKVDENKVKVDENKVKVGETEVKVEEKKMETDTSKVEDKDGQESKIPEGETVVERKIEMDTETEMEKKVEETEKTEKVEIEKTSSFKEETNLSSDLKENEMKALNELRSKLEEAILQNKLFLATKEKEKEIPSTTATKPGDDNKDPKEKTGETQKEGGEKEGESSASVSAEEVIKAMTKEQVNVDENEKEKEAIAKGKQVVEEEESKENIVDREAETEYIVDKDIALWGVPLLPSKGDNRTDTVLLKFLKAKDFKVNDAFEMLRNTMKWRKENKIDSILDEEIGADVGSMASMEGHDRNGHPVCYNFFSVLGNEEMSGKTFEERREKFTRGRIQLMEKGIQKLDFKPGGVSAILQISDLKNTPLPTKKELRNATKKVVELLQDNYPEFVAKNIFINVPFWYYAYSALFSPSLSQRTKNKIVYARSARVSDTLLKYIPASQIPVQYGGLKRETDAEFTVGEEVKEATVKAGSTEVIEIPTPAEGKTIVWEVSVSGWEVNYKEEFVPADEGSYTVIVSKVKRIAVQDAALRNSFTSKEAGKIVITIENGAFKKKRILYRYKINDVSSSSSTSS
ncbi:Sec14p-like phosphatidylinositol transfer family protein [Euphorbia peplus]|nr:Sec14p-like phosphatidylinositol transfer family protein [Euphorbia peplus]